MPTDLKLDDAAEERPDELKDYLADEALLADEIAHADRLAEVLLKAEDFAESMRRIFAHPNFTDRHNDAGKCEAMRSHLEWTRQAHEERRR